MGSGKHMIRGQVAGGLELLVTREQWRLVGVSDDAWRNHDQVVNDIPAAWGKLAEKLNKTMTSDEFSFLFGSFDVTKATDTAQVDFLYAQGGKAMGSLYTMYSNVVYGIGLLNNANRDEDPRLVLRHFRSLIGLCPDNSHLITDCPVHNCYPWQVGAYATGRGIWSGVNDDSPEAKKKFTEKFNLPSFESFYRNGMPMNIFDQYRDLTVRS